MQKQICLITGATDGVGKATAIELARRGFTVVIAARDEAKAAATKTKIATLAGRADIDHILCDLRSLAQVRRAAEEFKRRYPRLDVLINNAGIFVGQRTLTADGFESMYQVNYLSHFLLTNLLLDDLRRSPDARIINLTSNIYTLGTLDLDTLRGEKRFSALAAYSASKLFMLMCSVELARKLAGTSVTAYAVHPGVVRTPMMLKTPGVFRLVSYLAIPFSVSPEKGARTSVFLATQSAVKGESGCYFVGAKKQEIKTKYNSSKARELLWETSLANVGIAGSP